MSIYLIVLDGRNPAIPAAEKKQRQRLKMSQEKKDTQREKERLSKNAKHQEENQEESDQHRKINCECMKRKQLFETQEESVKRRKTDSDSKRRKRDTEGDEQCAKHNNRATMEAKQYLHRTQDAENPHMHRAIVCIECDRFIIGMETIHKLTKEDIGVQSGRLGVKSYKEFYQTTLKDEVKRQYQVQGLQDMLLSPRSRKYPDGYATCSICYSAMQPQMASKKTPPKFATANGFVIGSFHKR